MSHLRLVVEELLRPTLETVQRHKIGKFYERRKVKGEIIVVKSVIHPRWFEHKDTTNPYTLYVPKHLYDALTHDGKASTRWRSKPPKWVQKADDPAGVGYWTYHVRTGKTGPGKYVKGERLHRFRKPKSKVGRPPSGGAYKLRREIWRVFASDSSIGSLFPIQKDSKKVGKRVKVSIRLPNLELALYEFLVKFFNFEKKNLSILQHWADYKDLGEYNGEDISALIYADKEDRQAFLWKLCQKYWKAVLIDLVERNLGYFHNIFYDSDKVRSKNLNSLDSVSLSSSILIAVYNSETSKPCVGCGQFDWFYPNALDEQSAFCNVCGLTLELKKGNSI